MDAQPIFKKKRKLISTTTREELHEFFVQREGSHSLVRPTFDEIARTVGIPKSTAHAHSKQFAKQHNNYLNAPTSRPHNPQIPKSTAHAHSSSNLKNQNQLNHLL
jgi:hypothetical protein